MKTETQVEESKEIKVKTNIGKNGMKFIQGFGFFLNEFRNEPGNRELVKSAMLENFPAKTGFIEKWLDWYKGYFNMKKIKAFQDCESITWNK